MPTPTPISISRAIYDALMTAALAGDTTEVRRLRGVIDELNSIRRYSLYIRWQNVGGTRPSRIEVAKGWPALETFLLELERPISRADVDEVLRTQATNPADVHVTPDRNGIVGWSILGDYIF
jgi:hypothetical protein